MARRFPVLYPMPFGEGQYREYLALARSPIQADDYARLCWERILPEKKRVCREHRLAGVSRPLEDCTRCMRYEWNMTSKTIANLTSWGFLSSEKEAGTGRTAIRTPRHSAEYVDGSLGGGFSELVQLSLERAWASPKGDQVALEAFVDILERLPKSHQEPISQKQLRDELSMETNPVTGYDFNVASGGSARTLRELLKIMDYIGVASIDESGRCRLTSNDKHIRSVRRSLRYLSPLKVGEEAIEVMGPSHPALSESFIMALSKYYLYRQCRGIGKQRRLMSILMKEMDRTHADLLSYYKRDANQVGRRVGRGKSLANTAKNYRRLKARMIASRLGILRDSVEYGALRRLSVSSLDRLESSNTPDELSGALKRAKGRFDRSTLDEIRHRDGPFVLPKDFEFFSSWQGEAVNDWMRGIPAKAHKKHSGIVSAVTGSGKTVMAMLAIQEYVKGHPDACVSVIVPTKVLMYQWARELAKLLGLSSKEIGLRGDGFRDSFSGGKRVVTSIVNSAIRDENLKKDIERLSSDTSHLLIADECHRYGGNQFQRVFDCRIDARLGLSATPPSDEGSSEGIAAQDPIETESSAVVSALGGPPFYHLNYKRARGENLICEFTVKYVGVHLTPKERQEYDRLTKSIGRALEKIRLRYGHRIDAMSGDSLDQKLNAIIRRDEHPDPSIGQYFRLTRARRDIVYGCRNRKVCYDSLLRDGIDGQRKIMIFHERISQLEGVVAPVYRRLDREIDPREREVNKDLEEWLTSVQFRPVMYHSLQDPKWNAWSMEWFRRDIANTMLSVKALVEGVDVPAADLGIVRVSSSSVRQRIQTIGRILRKGREKTAEIFVIFVMDSVEANIFRAYDWQRELGQAAIAFFEWDDVTEELVPKDIRELPVPPVYEDKLPPLEVDTSDLTPGDRYPGRYAGDLYHVTADGEPYKRTRYGRLFLHDAPIRAAAQLVKTLKGGGKMLVTPQGNIVTKLKTGDIAFLGMTNPDALRSQVSSTVEGFRSADKGRRRTKQAPTFEELFGSGK